MVTPVKISLKKNEVVRNSTEAAAASTSSTPASGNSAAPPKMTMPKIMLNKLTKEAEEAMTQSQRGGGGNAAAVRALIDGPGKDRLKAEELGVYDGCTPRSMRNKQVRRAIFRRCQLVYKSNFTVLRIVFASGR